MVPGDLLVSRVHYTGTAGMIVPGKTVLPTGADAIADGASRNVWDNVHGRPELRRDSADLPRQISPTGASVAVLAAPVGRARVRPEPRSRLLSGSFSSKSELALNLSTGG